MYPGQEAVFKDKVYTVQIELSKVVQSPHQVRVISQDEELWELAKSIKQHGLLQPIKVRPTQVGYELVYGHRRLAAMRLLGWIKCEATVEGVTEEDSLIQSIVENLQRQNLDVLDEARSYQALLERGYTIKEISELIKKPQGRVSNRLSILRLPLEVQELVTVKKGQHATTTEEGRLSADSASRIASAAITPEEAIALAQRAISQNLTSREIRELTTVLKETESQQDRQLLIQGLPEATNGRVLGTQASPETSRASEGTISPSHRKILWNLQRIGIECFDHFTIGYSERTIEQFVEILHLAKVELLADVRRVPISQFRPDFSKSNLSRVLSSHNIKYIHWPDLGIPPEIRQSLRNTNNSQDLFDWYDINIRPEIKLQKYSDILRTHRVAFMCVEVDPQSCHRHRIAYTLEKDGCKLLDL